MREHVNIMVYQGDESIDQMNIEVQKHFDRFGRLPEKIMLPTNIYRWYEETLISSDSVRRILKFRGIRVIEL